MVKVMDKKKNNSDQPATKHDLLVVKEELRAEIRAAVAGVKEELRAEIRETAKETRRHLKVAAETISDEVRGGFRDAAALLRGKLKELEERVGVLEEHARVRRP